MTARSLSKYMLQQVHARLGIKKRMATKNKKNSLLCPNCRRLVSRSDSACPYCGLKHPGSFWKDNLLTRGIKGDKSILEILLVVNIAMFVFSLLIDPSTSSFVGNPFSFLAPTTRSLWVLGATGTIPLFQSGHWWSLIAASFLHGGLVHIAFNMIALYQLEPLVIDIYGNNRTIAIYILAGVAGFFLSALAGVGLTIGASASICGLIGALLYYGWNRGGTYGKAIFHPDRHLGDRYRAVRLPGARHQQLGPWRRHGLRICARRFARVSGAAAGTDRSYPAWHAVHCRHGPGAGLVVF